MYNLMTLSARNSNLYILHIRFISVAYSNTEGHAPQNPLDFFIITQPASHFNIYP